MAHIGETFGGGASAASSRPVVARYTVLEKIQVRKTADPNSSKVAVLKPGETVDVIKVGSTNSKGRTRLKIKDPPGWCSDKNKDGLETLSKIDTGSAWSTGSIDMSAFEPGGVGRDSFHDSDAATPGLSSVDEGTSGAESSPSASPSAGSVSELGAPPAAVPRHPTSAGAVQAAPTQAGLMSAFGQEPAPTAVFGQPAPAAGVLGKAEANAMLLPVIATLPGPAFEYMAGWVADQGSEFAAAVSAARQAHQLIPAAAFGSGNATF